MLLVDLVQVWIDNFKQAMNLVRFERHEAFCDSQHEHDVTVRVDRLESVTGVRSHPQETHNPL